MKRYSVSQLARLAHVTVRTLHHYDEIGLLVPSSRSSAGYREYAEDDLARLQEILMFRELGFSLEAIERLLEQPPAERKGALVEQRALVTEQQRKTAKVLRALDNAIAALAGEPTVSGAARFDGFEEFDHAKYEDEARERWGHTEAYQESARRTKRYRQDDWRRIKAEGEAVLARFVALFDEGAQPEDAAARAAAEEARLHIDRWFYPLSREHHVGLADMYLEDPRFTAYYDRHREGLGRFVAAAIKANASR